MRTADEPRVEGAPTAAPRELELVDVADAWELEARCRGADAGLFFGPNRFEPKRERLAREQRAKEICWNCPALGPCREYALANAEPYGVWGGLGETERRAMLEGDQAVARAG